MIIRGQIPTNTKGKLFFGRAWDESENIEKELKDNKIDIIWNLQEIPDRKISQIINYHTPIQDFSIPEDINKFRKEVCNIVCLLDNFNVFVHCKSGHGRTGLAVASVLIELGLSLNKAFLLTEEFVQGPETLSQINFVKGY